MRCEDFFEIIDGIDDDIILDIPEVNVEKPLEVVVKSKRAPFWTIAASAACLLCVLAIGVFVAAKLQSGQPVGPGPNDSTATENSSNESDSNSSGSDSSETSESASNSSGSAVSDSSAHESQGVYLGNGLTLLGTLLDESELEEFSIEPYTGNSWYWGEAEEEFLDSLEIPELKDVYKRAQDLFACLSTVRLNPTFAAAGNGRKPARIEITKDDAVYGGEYMESGYTYESFNNSYLSAYTKETAEEIFKEYDFFLNYNGAMLFKDTARGGNLDEVHREYELISKSDTVIECRRIVFNHDRDFKPSMEWNPELRDEYVITYTGFGFVLTEDGWRVRVDNLDEGLIY